MSNATTAPAPATIVIATILAALADVRTDLAYRVADTFSSVDAGRDYAGVWATVAVWVAAEGRITATVADTYAGRIHGDSILTEILDATAAIDSVFATAVIEVNDTGTGATLTW